MQASYMGVWRCLEEDASNYLCSPSVSLGYVRMIVLEACICIWEHWKDFWWRTHAAGWSYEDEEHDFEDGQVKCYPRQLSLTAVICLLGTFAMQLVLGTLWLDILRKHDSLSALQFLPQVEVIPTKMGLSTFETTQFLSWDPHCNVLLNTALFIVRDLEPTQHHRHRFMALLASLRFASCQAVILEAPRTLKSSARSPIKWNLEPIWSLSTRSSENAGPIIAIQTVGLALVWKPDPLESAFPDDLTTYSFPPLAVTGICFDLFRLVCDLRKLYKTRAKWELLIAWILVTLLVISQMPSLPMSSIFWSRDLVRRLAGPGDLCRSLFDLICMYKLNWHDCITALKPLILRHHLLGSPTFKEEHTHSNWLTGWPLNFLWISTKGLCALTEHER